MLVEFCCLNGAKLASSNPHSEGIFLRKGAWSGYRGHDGLPTLVAANHPHGVATLCWSWFAQPSHLNTALKNFGEIPQINHRFASNLIPSELPPSARGSLTVEVTRAFKGTTRMVKKTFELELIRSQCFSTYYMYPVSQAKTSKMIYSPLELLMK